MAADEDKIKWKQIAATALVSGLVTLGTGSALFFFQRREPKLEYTLTSGLPFEGTQEKIAVFELRVANNGGREIRDVVARLDVTPRIIRDSRVSFPPTAPVKTVQLSASVIEVRAANLNPSEVATLAVLIAGVSPKTGRPIVSVRGEGVTGLELDASSQQNSRAVLWSSLLPAYAGLFAAILFFRGWKSQVGKHPDDEYIQNKVLAYLCTLYGLPDDAAELLRRLPKASYWSEADHFTSIALSKDPTDKDVESRKKVLLGVLKYAQVHRQSEGVLHYDISRIARHQGRSEEAEQHLEMAQKLIPKLLQTRRVLDGTA